MGKRAKELSKLLEASDSMENALVKAAKAFEGDLDKNAWRYANGEHRAKNLESLSKAINKQVESRMRISGLMTRADEEKIALLMRKLEMEERKEAQEREQNGGVRLMLDGGVEELAE